MPKIPDIFDALDWIADGGWKKVWEFADRVFRLAAWTLYTAALVAVQRKTNSAAVLMVCIAFAGLWIAAAFSVSIAVAEAGQNWALGTLKSRNSIRYAIVVSVFSMSLMGGMLWLFGKLVPLFFEVIDTVSGQSH